LRFEYPRECLFKALMFSIMPIDIVSSDSYLLAYDEIVLITFLRIKFNEAIHEADLAVDAVWYNHPGHHFR